LDFENDIEALETAILEVDQRIKKLEVHKDSVNKEIREGKSDNKTVTETLRRLERNLKELHKKQVFLIKERDSKSLSL
jgi:uncharacterized protein (DUF3084 family)